MSEDRINAIGKELANLEEHKEGKSYLIDLSKKYEEPRFTLSLNGVGTMPRGDVQAIKAKSKNGKSFLCSIFMASILGCKTFGLESEESSPVVLYFDTEQNERNTAVLARRVHTLLGWPTDKNHEGFKAFSLRTMEEGARIQFIENTIKEVSPSNVFIDGVADLILNFNDVEESNLLMERLLTISSKYDCAVCCVLHTNKAKEDSGMKGHLGTFLLQKSSDVYEVKKSNGAFTVTETDCRNATIEDFAFAIGGSGIPFGAQTLLQNKDLAKLEEITTILKQCFSSSQTLSYNELVNAYHENAAVSSATAKRRVSDAKKNGLIKLIPGVGYSMG